MRLSVFIVGVLAIVFFIGAAYPSVQRRMSGGVDEALLASIQDNNLAAMSGAIEDGARVSGTQDLSPLLVASVGNHFDAANLLLNRGADPNRALKGYTPLMGAMTNANLSM